MAAGPDAVSWAPVATRAAWADLEVLCLTAMHKDPARRYQTVDALIRDTDHFLKGEPLEARPDTIRYRVGKFAKRNAPAVMATAGVLGAIAALVTFSPLSSTTARNAA